MKSNKISRVLIVFGMVSLCMGCTPNGDSVSEPKAVAVHDSVDATNDFYDNEPTVELPGTRSVLVEGEVIGAGTVDLGTLPLHSVIVKETILKEGEAQFVGAYRYDGISLYDLLNTFTLNKKNREEFKPIIDAYVVVYGAAGDSTVISWGEIYYPIHTHQILIATKVMRIVPSKTKDKWPLPEKTRLIVGSDLITERNISEPVRVVVRSIGIPFKVDRSVQMWAPELVLTGLSEKPEVLTKLPDGTVIHDLDQVFYGRGMGIHGITTFRGGLMKDLIIKRMPVSPEKIKTGLFVIAAIDGYRCAMTFSEVMNRNDNMGVILMDENNYEQAGRFSCLFGADFFSDRAIKAMTEIRLVY